MSLGEGSRRGVLQWHYALYRSSCSQSGRAGSAGWPGSWLVEGMPRPKALAAGDVARHSKQMLLFLHSSSRPLLTL